MSQPPQSPAGYPPLPNALWVPPRTSTLTSRVALPVADEGPGFVRFRPFNDARVILFLRGEGPRPNVPGEVTPFWSRIGTARLGPFAVEVLRHKQVLSPPPWQPGMSPLDPQDYEPVDDVLLLPDGELRIPRTPRGFADAEIGFIVGSIQLHSTLSGGAQDPQHRDYLPGDAPPAAPLQLRPQPPARAAEPSGITSQSGTPQPGTPLLAAPLGAAPLQGADVVLEASTFNMPGRCASCGAPKETTLNTARTQSRAFRGKVTRTFAIPYCNVCAARVKGTRSKGIMLGLATLGVAVALAAINFAVPGLPLAVLVGLPTLLAIGFGVVAMTALAPRPPPAPAVGTGDAVRLISFKDERSVLHCVNPVWAQAFAQANGVPAVPKTRSSRFGTGALWVGLLFGPGLALGAWFVTHPEVHVDNAGPEPLQVWLDGEPALVVAPNPGGTVPPSFRVAYGHHTFGYSKMGAARAEDAVDARASMMDDFLYNPGKTGCYWVIADSYGSASVNGLAQGPQSLQEFYSFDKIDTWFGDNPQTVQVSSGSSGDTRIAVQRAKACMELAERGCDEPARQAFIQCVKGVKSDEGFEQCERAVTCDAKGEPPESSPVASVPTHAGHAPAEPRPTPRPGHPPQPAPTHSVAPVPSAPLPPHPATPAASGSAKHT